MRILVFTTLYPSAAMPAHGIFVENRLRAVKAQSGADIRVIAPVPWFPTANPVFGAWAKWAAVPAMEQRHGIEIVHPRYLLPPKIGMTYAVHSLEHCLRRAINMFGEAGWDFDILDAHYFYPDGVAAVRVAKALGKPVSVTARGTDINLIPDYPRQRRMILDAAHRADLCITVADALRDRMVELGAIPEKIVTLRNGVDLAQFTPGDRAHARERLGLPPSKGEQRTIASVGHLIERKGHDLVIRSLKDLPDTELIIAGHGPEYKPLERLAHDQGLAERVTFLGAVPPEQICDVYRAADMLVLASSREGWPNVLLEAMACGTPCVATPIWGSVEVIRHPDAGLLAAERSAPALTQAITELTRTQPDRARTRRYAERFSWDETAQQIDTLFTTLTTETKAKQTIRCAPVRCVPVRSPSARPSDQRPKLIVTVDTEEIFDWSRFEPTGFEVGGIGNIERFQALAIRHGCRPLYFLTWPVMADTGARAIFQTMATHDSADFGLHMHQWVTPPDAGLTSPYYSFQKNIPYTVKREKFDQLVRLYRDVFGKAPRAHRAGRYGIGLADYPLLKARGIDHDFSPSAGFDFSAQGGPDFSTMGNHPFRVLTNEIESGENGNPVFVTPVTGALAYRHTRRFASLDHQPGFAAEITRKHRPWQVPLRLTPEGLDLNDMQALATHLSRSDLPVMTLSFHSTSFVPGATEYTQSEQDVDAFLQKIDDFLTFFTQSLKGDLIDLAGLDRLYRGEAF